MMIVPCCEWNATNLSQYPGNQQSYNRKGVSMNITDENICFVIESEWRVARNATSHKDQIYRWSSVIDHIQGAIHLAITLGFYDSKFRESTQLLIGIAYQHAYPDRGLSNG